MSQETPLIAERYRLEELIGRGGMGDVYRGTDVREGETVAIKLLHPHIVEENPDIVDRFTREGEALRRLNHPNIVTIRDAVTENGRHYLVMEYVSGGSLRDLIDEQARLPVEAVLNVALDLADALTRAHRLNIIHRDIKPDNVLLAEDGTPRLTDFGVAHIDDRTRLTQTGSVIGTYAYLSPEACNGLELDERADIWSFGVMLFELLTGRVPFLENTSAAILTAILTKPAPDLTRLRPQTPPQLVDLIYRMLEKDRNRRISSVRLVGAELEAIIRSLDTPLRQKVVEAGHEVTIGSRFATPSDEQPGTPDVPAMERHTPRQGHGFSLYPTPDRPSFQQPAFTPGGTPISSAEIAQATTRKWQLIALMVIVTVLACSTVAVIAILLGPDVGDDGDRGQVSTPLPTVAPVREGEIMVLVAQLEPIDTAPREIARFIVDDLKLTLEEGVPFSRIGVRQYAAPITNAGDARAVAAETGATVLIWGNYTDARIDVRVQLGVADAFPQLALPLETVEQITDVRVSLDDPRADSVAPHVLGVLGGLQGAAGDVYAFMRTLAVIEAIDVQPAHIMGDNVAAYTHQFFQHYTVDTEAALESIERAIDKDPTNPFTHGLRSLALHRLGRFAAAQDAAETAARLAGERWTIPLILLASSATTSDAAIDAFSQIIAIEPDHWYALAARGTLYYLYGDPAQARADLEAAIALEPDSNFPYVFATLQALRDGRFEDATTYIAVILDRYPDPDLYKRVFGATLGQHDNIGPLVAAFVNLALGRYDAAAENATAGLAIAPGSPDLWVMQGIVHCNQGRYGEAEDAYSTALRVSSQQNQPDNARTLIHLLRGDVRLKQEQDAAARRDFGIAAESEVIVPAFVDSFASGAVGCENLFGSAALMTSGTMSQLEMAATPVASSRIPIPTNPVLAAVDPVTPGQYMVLVANLEPVSGVAERDVARFVADDLKRQLEDATTYDKIAVRRYPGIIRSETEAASIAMQTGASVIVWGYYSPDVIALDVQLGTTGAFPYIPFERGVIEALANVRVQLTNEREESAALPVMSVLSLLALADGDEFEWTLMMLVIDALDVTPAAIQGSSAAAYTHRAIAHFVADTAAALDAFDSALTRAGGNPLLYALRGLAHLRQHDEVAARSDFDTAARLAPDDWAMPIYLALEIPDPDEAIATLQRLQDLRPDDWYAYFLEAVFYYDSLAQLDASKSVLERSFANDPEANLPYIVGMMIALREGDIAQAQDYAASVLSEFPDPELTTRAFNAVYGGEDPNLLTGLYFEAATNLVLGQYAPIAERVGAAMDDLFASTAAPGLLGEQINSLSDLFLMQGLAECNLDRHAAAETAYSQALRFSRDYALAYVLRAQMQRAQADRSGAADDFAAAREHTPSPAFDVWIDAAESGDWTCKNFLDYLPETSTTTSEGNPS